MKKVISLALLVSIAMFSGCQSVPECDDSSVKELVTSDLKKHYKNNYVQSKMRTYQEYDTIKENLDKGIYNDKQGKEIQTILDKADEMDDEKLILDLITTVNTFSKKFIVECTAVVKKDNDSYTLAYRIADTEENGLVLQSLSAKKDNRIFR